MPFLGVFLAQIEDPFIQLSAEKLGGIVFIILAVIWLAVYALRKNSEADAGNNKLIKEQTDLTKLALTMASNSQAQLTAVTAAVETSTKKYEMGLGVLEKLVIGIADQKPIMTEARDYSHQASDGVLAVKVTQEKHGKLLETIHQISTGEAVKTSKIVETLDKVWEELQAQKADMSRQHDEKIIRLNQLADTVQKLKEQAAEHHIEAGEKGGEKSEGLPQPELVVAGLS